MSRAALLLVYCALWGLVVEGADRLNGDPFSVLDMVTMAVQVALAILLWPLFRRAVDVRAGR